ncbi:copper resistance CopC/CopD family protein [Mesorhizobium sp. A623]
MSTIKRPGRLFRALRKSGTGVCRAAACLLCLLWVLAALALPAPAFAHAALIGTEPADGAVLAQSPDRFSLTFSEPVSPLVLSLVKPGGGTEALTSFRLDGQTVEIDNAQELGKGTYVLSWRVISTDGHPVAGSLLFSIGAAGTAPVASEPVDWSLRSAIWLAKVCLYIGLFIGVGGTFVLCWLSPAAGKRVVVAALWGGIVAAVVSLGFQGLDALGLPLARIAEPLVWKTALGTTFGWTVVIGLCALGLGLLSLIVPCLLAKTLSLVALVGVGVALAASGHASAAEPQWLTRPMVFLHGVGIAFWAGALIPLGLALKGRTVESGLFLRRFSKTIMPVVVVLAGAGIVLAVIQVQTPSALVATAYGRLLLIKLGLLAVLFAFAAFNRWRLTAPTEAGDEAARKKLVRSIGVETVIVLAIFGVVAGWRFTPPPRALAIAAAQPASIHIHTLKAMADISITPGHTGPVAASIFIMTGDFGPLNAKEMTLVLSKPDSGIEPLKRPAKKAGDGTWRVDDLVIPLPGKWTVGLDILVSDFDAVKIEGPIDIRP